MAGIPEGYGRITPYLLYADANAARDFLVKAFGFVEVEAERFADDEGRIGHTAFTVVDQTIMIGSPGDHHEGPAIVGNTVHVYIYVDDLQAHHDRAEAAGANIVSEIETAPYGDKRYRVHDTEGHEWWFAEHIPKT